MCWRMADVLRVDAMAAVCVMRWGVMMMMMMVLLLLMMMMMRCRGWVKLSWEDDDEGMMELEAGAVGEVGEGRHMAASVSVSAL